MRRSRTASDRGVSRTPLSLVYPQVFSTRLIASVWSSTTATVMNSRTFSFGLFTMPW